MQNYIYKNQYIKVGSRNIRYVKEGEGESIVLIHGLGGSLEWWDLIIPDLAKKYCVYAIDIPGFGLSDSLKEEVTDSFFTSFLIELLDELSIQKTSIIGHSMGGYISLRTAMNNINRINKLVLVSSAGFGKIQNKILKFLSIPILGDIAATPTRLGVKIFIDSLMYDKQIISKNRIDIAFQYFKRPNAKLDFLKVLRGRKNISHNSKGLSFPNELINLNIPILLVWGNQDSVFSVSQAKQASIQLVNSELRTFDVCGHLPQIEHAKEFSNIINHFLLQNHEKSPHT